MHDGTNPCENGGGICTKMKRRLKSAAFSIVILAAVLAATVFGGVHSNGILPASALPSSVGFYAVSYLNIENGDGAELLKSDLDYMKERGLAALLPADIRSGNFPASGGYVMLFFENCGAFETITDILQQRGMRGGFAALCRGSEAAEKSGSEGITIAVYGNGVNEFGTSYDGITLLNRIVRLPDWTIEEYFSSIAQPPAS